MNTSATLDRQASRSRRAEGRLTDGLRSVPTLDAIAQDPTLAADLAPEDARRLVLRCSAILMTITAAGVPAIAAEAVTPAAIPEDEGRLMKVDEAAAFLAFAKSYVYELIRRKEFPHVRRGKYVRIRRSALVEWIRRKEAGLDFQDSTVLPSSHDRRAGSAGSQAASADARRVRGKDRRPLDHGLSVGEWPHARERARGAAPSAHRKDGGEDGR